MDDVQEFERYMDHLSGGLGHADRPAELPGHGVGLMAPLKPSSWHPRSGQR